jgi:hypothetical protein
MTSRLRIGPALLIAALLVAAASPALGASWAESRLDPAGGRSLLDSLPPTGLPTGWVLQQPGVYQPGSVSQRTTSVAVDPLRATVRETYRQGDVQVEEPLVADLATYNQVLSRRTTERVWRNLTRPDRSVQRTGAARGGLFRVEIPIQLPKPLRSIVGDGAPNLEVSGSESITLGGTSNWTARKSDTEQRRQSKFPSLEMKQELNVNLTGSIGDKIKVDVDQSSAVTTSLDNKVKLRFEGDDDDMVKLVELGNTNLSLAGASFRQDGLFGVKTVMKLGTVDLTTIASKQEGKSETSRFTPSGERAKVQVDDMDYIPRRYYLIADHELAWDRGSLVVYKDDQQAGNNTAFVVPGVARVDPDAPFDTLAEKSHRGSWNRLDPGQDYDILTKYVARQEGHEIPIIRFRSPLFSTDIIAVTYVERSAGVADSVGSTDLGLVDPSLGKGQDSLLLQLIKVDPSKIERRPDGRFDPAGWFYPTLFYEMRNFYDLRARNIALETLNLTVRRRDSSQATDPDNLDGRPFIEAFGLDQRDRNGAPQPDGRIDDQFIDEIEGILFFPDLHPFDPDIAVAPGDTCAIGYGGFLCLDNFGRNPLREKGSPGEPEGLTQANDKVYYYLNPNSLDARRFYIDAEFRSSQQGFYLGRFNILENSEQVKVDGILQSKGKDYGIDYDTGQITFLRIPGPDQVVTVDYSFAPGVGQVQRTLLGFSSSYVPTANFSLSSSMIYESRGASEQNPKLGEEPARSIIGDLSTVTTVRPSFMTDLANRIPGVRTNQASTLNVQGGISVSLPNPNTQGEAYLDDMEGNTEQTSISLSRSQWSWSSVPFDSLNSRLSYLPADHARVQWYNARGAKERDLKPVLTNEEGGDNERQVLELNVKLPSDSSSFTSRTWTGLTQNFSRLGDDFSKYRFLEIWVNDRTRVHSDTHGILHIDLGEVEEDAFWQADAGPNNRLDTEDRNRDTKLDADEDTGLDTLFNYQEPDYDRANRPDPNGDDYRYDLDRPTEYGKINGTEGNGQGDLNARPDTEDLNLNGGLDTDNNYFTTSIHLADPTYVVTDVAGENPAVPSNNGWRLFRIPIESLRTGQGAPHWDNIRHVRLWLSGLEGTVADSLNLQIGGVELVGNRWLVHPTDSATVAKGHQPSLLVASRNNKDNAGTYTSPFEVKRAPGGKATQREQSLALLYAAFRPGDSRYAFRTIGDAGQGVGWTQYREVRFWVHGDDDVEAQKLRVVARFGADTISYYEYSVPVAKGWKEVVVPMDVLARLKEGPTGVSDTTFSTGAPDEQVTYRAVGRPSFTRIGRITFGLAVPASAPDVPAGGEVWVNELRVGGVRRDRGTTTNLVVQANFADVLAMNAGYQNQDADFFRVGTGLNRGSGLNHSQWNFSSTFNLDRMIPRTGLQLPARFTYQKTTDVPRYRIGSDVVLDAARADIETSRSNRQSFDLSYQRTGNRRGWTRYTFDALNARMQYGRSGAISPQSADSSWTFSSSANYDLPLGGGRGLGLLKRMRFKLLPENIRLGTNWTSSRNVSYARSIQSNLATVRRDEKTRLLGLSAGTSYAPINSLTLGAGVTSDRNMLLHERGPFGWNRGTEVRHTQRLDLSFSPRWLTFLTPNLNMNGSYSEAGGPDRRVASTDPTNIKDVTNLASTRLTLSLPLGRLANRAGRATSVRDTSRSFLSAPLRLLRGRVMDVQATFNIDRSTTLTRVVGNPGFAFKSGFTQVFDPGLVRLGSSQLANSRRYAAGANTGLKILPSLSADLRADRSLSFTDAAYGARRTGTVSWPDVTLRWLELQRLLGLSEAITSLILNTHYTLKVDETGPIQGRIERRSESTNWGPLLGWQASWKNGLRTDVTTTFSEFRDVDVTALGSARVRQTKNHDIRLSKLFPASRGIRFPWSRKRVRLPNDLNLSLSTSLRNNKSRTVNPFGFSTVEQDQQTLDVQTGTSYNFSQSITGGFNMGFGQTKDNKSDLTQRRVSVAFNAQFRF